MNSIAEKIAIAVDKAGGKTFYVGGFVRDKLLGIENKDVDIEVHWIEPETLYHILETVGEPLTFGKSFGVFALRGEEIDIAMPRRERAVGAGHRDFEIDVDPYIGTESAARRRDFTINSLMQDVLTGELIDHFGGREDIANGVIRHIDPERFKEDPLRVLRAAQFAARFCSTAMPSITVPSTAVHFTIAPSTIDLCRMIDLSTLSKERVEEELKKALLKADRPSIFFESLRAMDQLHTWFPELEALIGLEQDPVFHPEGDVWTHTMEVLDRAAEFRDMVSDPYRFMLLALTHDLGKIVTTEEKNGRIHAYEHETKGMPLVEGFIRRITNEREVIAYLKNMVPLHMRPNVSAYSKPSVKSTNRMFDEAAAPEDLIWFAAADKPVFAGTDAFEGDNAFLFERLHIFEETMAKPYIMGRDLIEAGLDPGEDFTVILAYAHKLRLAGIDKDSALKQTLSYARKLRKKA